MARSRSFRFITVCLMVVIALSLVVTLLPMQKDAAAESICPASSEFMELSYDDGTMQKYVKTVCPSCAYFQGVQFSLPSGLTSATINSVRFYCKPAFAGAQVEVYVKGADHVTDLVPVIGYSVARTGWQTVALSGAVASGDFYVLVRRFQEGTSLGSDYYADNGRSYAGEHWRELKRWRDGGDIMVRASVTPEIHVGVGQPYATIQAAVDAASSGLSIVVHPGTYNENVTVHKSVTIKSLSGPVKTIVQGSPDSDTYSDNNVFRITASCVRLSGFTIQNADRAGVRLEDASDCLVSGNLIRDNNYGIYVSENSTSNILLENECTSNTNGIYVDGAQNHVSGNKLHGNTAPIGSAVFLSDVASGNRLRFNTITVDPEAGAVLAAGAQVYNANSAEEGSATENWWGDASGPANAGGQGPVIGEKVLYEPWLKVPPLRVKTAASATEEYTVNARGETSTTVTKRGSGTPVVSVASFAANPAGKFPTKPMGKWVDVLYNSADGVEEAEISVFYTAEEIAGLKEGSLRLYWWNGQKWKACSKSGVDKISDFVWAKVGLKSKPSVTDLNGTYFAVGLAKGGISWWVIPLIIVIVVILLIAFRLFWVLVVKSERAV